MAIFPSMHCDANGNPIPVMRVGAVVNDQVTGTSRESTLPTGAKVIEIASTTDCYITLGLTGGTADSTTSFFFPKGVAQYGVDEGQTHIQYIQESAVGRITIVELY
jgi:hypothetical protein